MKFDLSSIPLGVEHELSHVVVLKTSDTRTLVSRHRGDNTSSSVVKIIATSRVLGYVSHQFGFA